jgi:hypothetical protein
MLLINLILAVGYFVFGLNVGYTIVKNISVYCGWAPENE